MCYPAEVCRCMSNGTSVINEIHLKKRLIPGVLPFKVTQGYRKRYATDDFLLTTMSLSCTVCEINGDFSQKLQNFPIAVQAFDCDAVMYNRL